MDKGALFAEKVDALVNRCRGRDIYDVIFILQRKFPLSEAILRAKEWKTEPRQTILKHIENIKQQELVRLAKQVEPFLINEEETDFILNAKTYIRALIK